MKNIYSVLGYIVAAVLWLNANYTLDITLQHNATIDKHVWSLRLASHDTQPDNRQSGSNVPPDDQ